MCYKKLFAKINLFMTDFVYALGDALNGLTLKERMDWHSEVERLEKIINDKR